MEIIRKLKDGREISSEVKPNQKIPIYGDEVSIEVLRKKSKSKKK